MYMYTCIYGFAFYRFTCSCFIYLSPVEKEKQAFIHDYNMIQRIATSGRWTEGMHWLTQYVTFNHPNCWGCFSINSNGFMRSGVVIVQDYIGMPQQPGNQVVHADEASWMAEVMKSESVLEPSIFGDVQSILEATQLHMCFFVNREIRNFPTQRVSFNDVWKTCIIFQPKETCFLCQTCGSCQKYPDFAHRIPCKHITKFIHIHMYYICVHVYMHISGLYNKYIRISLYLYIYIYTHFFLPPDVERPPAWKNNPMFIWRNSYFRLRWHIFEWTILIKPIGSMGLVYLPTWMVDLYGKCRYTFGWFVW